MSKKIIVMDYHEALISRMQKQILAVRVSEPELVLHASNRVNDRNTLFCLLYEYNGSLVDMPFSEEWESIPMALFVEEMGDFTALAGRLPVLRKMNIKVYMSSAREESYRELKILASLGVHGCLIIDSGCVDWNRVSDLMHYVIYTRTRHANIDPFSHIVKKHRKDIRTDYNYVYFNDPGHFLHMGAGEEIALSHDHLRNGDFLDRGIDCLEKIDKNKKYVAYMNQWQEDFIKTRTCSFCAGWRVCLGKFSENENLEECSKFFTEMLEAVDYVKSRDKQKEPVS